ncbi:Co2+/Mg2+ efflux protein ApaG [Ramlibacter henchirensis]|uniref:Protein ApaG n=1 Tax=Ramlibacter henchirensis TaxID=204072 RepID=A0A4Z0C6U7_9BURK|nr:Co2+/Mg2+ efflux protein ApaG [Ramlibacter henchirensis]TFZ06612.1 Co2+/Mg2+ efflux protein ApaG [Ramlibacter henchirensis]
MAKYQFRVEVKPAYLPEESAPEAGVYTFAYTITISNVGEVAAQLISRHWIITDEAGGIQEVNGLGVVGHQPLLQPGQSFQYTSGCRLPTPSGTMQGSYFCVAEDGQRFDTEIAPFLLEDGSKRVLH